MPLDASVAVCVNVRDDQSLDETAERAVSTPTSSWKTRQRPASRRASRFCQRQLLGSQIVTRASGGTTPTFVTSRHNNSSPFREPTIAHALPAPSGRFRQLA